MLESEGRRKPVSRHTTKAATRQRPRSQLEAPKSELGPRKLMMLRAQVKSHKSTIKIEIRGERTLCTQLT